MRKKHFYDHLVDDAIIHAELSQLQITPEEKDHLHTIIFSNIHVVVLDTVLTHLSTEDKEKFLHHLEKEEHDLIVSFLKEKIENVEEKIQKVLSSLLEEFVKDIKEAKKKN